ncbi:OmpH family outer membrane protein [Candidatus Bipolaricaulota bacterium]|nr:OmpH family outer membrane protein [Candidatus Bipolaricaulota bacterium]
MSRNTLVVAGLALILAIGAVVLQFVLPSGDAGAPSADLDAIRADITALKQADTAKSLRIAYMDAEQAFTVFVLAVGDLRQQITDKNAEITKLQNDYNQGLISSEDSSRRYGVLQAELLDARMTTAAGTLDRMIASSKFADLRSSLITLREQAQPLIDGINDLVSTIRVGAIDTTEFQNRLGVYSATFEQFDGYVTSAATQKLVQATEKVARAQGFDLVIRKKDVIMYRNDLTVSDITETVKAEIADYL